MCPCNRVTLQEGERQGNTVRESMPNESGQSNAALVCRSSTGRTSLQGAPALDTAGRWQLGADVCRGCGGPCRTVACWVPRQLHAPRAAPGRHHPTRRTSASQPQTTGNQQTPTKQLQLPNIPLTVICTCSRLPEAHWIARKTLSRKVVARSTCFETRTWKGTLVQTFRLQSNKSTNPFTSGFYNTDTNIDAA